MQNHYNTRNARYCVRCKVEELLREQHVLVQVGDFVVRREATNSSQGDR